MKFKIENRRNIPEGYIGLNFEANKTLKFPYPQKHPEHTILIKSNLPKQVRIHTERHEEIEEYLIKNKHYPYHKAHKLALKFETYNIPFPKKNEKRELIKIGLIKR